MFFFFLHGIGIQIAPETSISRETRRNKVVPKKNDQSNDRCKPVKGIEQDAGGDLYRLCFKESRAFCTICSIRQHFIRKVQVSIAAIG